LEVLKTVEPDKSTEDSVKENINHVDGAMRELDDELKKVQGEKSELEARRAMRRHLRRAFYPFKEETLKKIRQVVDGAIQNLNLALQVLQVFVYLRILSVDIDQLC
jgi:predicted nuclease with TOPRIM domain